MIAAYSVSVDGKDITTAVNGRLISLTITDKPAMEADEVTLVIDNADGAVALPPVGATLSVAIGWKGSELVDKGTYKADEITHDGPPDKITIRARAADFSGPLKEQRELSYSENTLGDILTTIAQRLTLTPSIESGLAAIAITHIDQTNESDANFLTRLGEDYDAVATIKSGNLLFIPVGHPLTVSGQTLPTIAISRGDGDSHSYTEADRDGSTTGVKAKYRDYAAAATKYAVAGEDKEGSTKTLKRDFPSEAEAQAAAWSELSRLQRARRELRLSLVIGNPDVIANGTLSLSGWFPEVDDQRWLAGEVTHTIGDNGYTTELTAHVVETAE